MILKIFSPKKIGGKNLAFFARTTANFCKKMIIALTTLRKTPIFFAENWQKNVIITSTHDADKSKIICAIRTTLLEQFCRERFSLLKPALLSLTTEKFS
jgi:hypothetical protein